MSRRGSQSSSAARSTAEFFEQWAIYRKIVRHNYMGHDEIGAALRTALSERPDTGSFLDLGCGDAELPSRYLDGLGIHEYHGVDLAEAPLGLAAENLAGMVGSVQLHRCDQAAFMDAIDRCFDVIVLGFALHHNLLDDKASLLANAARHLECGGDLFVYDVFCKPGETRDSFFDRYLGWIGRTWLEMTPKEHMLIDAHIRDNDHPDSVSALSDCGARAGLAPPQVRLSTCNGFHVVLHFRASSHAIRA